MRADSTPGRRAVTVRLASIGLLAAGVAEGVDFVTPVPAAEGRWDLNAPPCPAERYLGELAAPARQLEWFEHSGHNPCYEELDRFSALMTGTVLAQATARETPRS